MIFVKRSDNPNDPRFISKQELIGLKKTGGVELVNIEDIKIPTVFSSAGVRKSKVIKASQFYVEHGYYDKPVTLIAETNEKGLHNKLLLVDGFSRYVSAKNMQIPVLPAKYISIEEYLNK